MPDRATYPHRILKVRTVVPAPGAEQPAHESVWLNMTPFPPGCAPVFQASLWFWCDKQLAIRSPVLRVSAAPPDAPAVPAAAAPAATDAGKDGMVNLWASPKFGVRTLADRTAGWRRIDFTLTLAGKPASDLLVQVLMGPEGGPMRRTVLGRVLERNGRWRFRPRPNLAPHPFTNETAGSRDGYVTGFVGGAPKSGTTWMQILLNQHPEVLSVGEGVFTNMIKLDMPLSSNQWFPPRLTVTQLRDFATELLIRRMVEMNRTVFQCRVVTDKTPGNSRLFRHLLTLVPEAKLVHCIRHPLDVVISRLHHELALIGSQETRAAGFVGDGSALQSMAPALAASETLPLSRPDVWPMVTGILDEWALFQEEALATAEIFPGQVLISRYEDMLTDGVGSAERVFAHLGVPTDRAIVEQCVKAASFDAIKGNAIAGGGGAAFFRKGTARQFEQAMTGADQETALAYLRERLPTFGKLGYEVTVRKAA